MVRTHHDLEVWRDGIALVKQVYAITARFPADEKFGLVVQLRRAAVSVPSNIAEGAARSSRKDFARFIAAARGSLAEIETQLTIANELGFCVAADLPVKEVDSLFARLNKLHQRLSLPPPY